ncbi:serine/threonine-protein kinase [Streptomyces sp. NPDC002187]|uniref:serine/threonine-protein kinase n=1 Tax=Streptomyces sp. NPDC002187 TaxID=3364637 RepID=UPI0036A758CF
MERGERVAGRYELVKRLGRGGMGEVWAARDHVLHRDVAVKLLVVGDGPSSDLASRFEREAVAAAQINHPNVAALYDRGVHEDVLFLVMEKVNGAALSDFIRGQGPMDPVRALAIADGVCAALVAAHEARVIHYDIKPHNVMLTPDGQVKVVDFGIAGFIQATFPVARSSQLVPAGTPEYGAPEQFLTERGDERSDLYALGSVLFTLLTGQPPHTGHNALAVIRRKLDEEAPRLDAIRVDLPPPLIELVAELLDREPARRPESARQVHERLLLLQTALSTTVPLPLPGPTRRLTEPADSFDMAWTGQEPLTTYTLRTRKQGRWKERAISSAIAALASAVGFYLALGVHYEASSGDAFTVWTAVLLCAIAATLYAIVALIGACLDLRVERLHERRTGWSLHVGPDHIVTTSAGGRQEYAWDQIQRVTIYEIGVHAPCVYTGLHVAQRGPARPPQLELCPAGWPYHWQLEMMDDAEDSDTPVPICVLGPLTEQQRTELVEALARYGGQRWDQPTPES